MAYEKNPNDPKNQQQNPGRSINQNQKDPNKPRDQQSPGKDQQKDTERKW